MKTWLLRGLALALVLALGGFLVAASGLVPIKASSGHWAVTEWFLRFGMKRSIASHSLGVEVPDNLSAQALVLKGAAHYENGCRACHGEPGRPQPVIAQAMLPMPPALAPRIRDSNPRQLFYIVKHGMKFTGMPAWPSQQRDDEVWALVAFLLKYPELDHAGYRALVQPEPDTPAVPMELAAPALSASSPIQSCVVCHGADGVGRPGVGYPLLAGQQKEYLANALHAYAKGRRHSGIMQPVAAALTADKITEITEHYSSLSPRARPTAVAHASLNPATIARGRTIALEGVPDQRVPACIECHGAGGKRRKPEYPFLAGQPAEYLKLQLTLFKDDRRGGSAHAHLMQTVASRLTPEHMTDVAAYFASLPAAPANDRR